MSGVLAVGGEGVRREEAVVTLAFEVVFFDVLEEIVETAIMVLMGFLLASVTLHNDYLSS